MPSMFKSQSDLLVKELNEMTEKITRYKWTYIKGEGYVLSFSKNTMLGDFLHHDIQVSFRKFEVSSSIRGNGINSKEGRRLVIKDLTSEKIKQAAAELKSRYPDDDTLKFNTMPLNYIYILGKNPVDVKLLTDRKQIPLFIKNEKMRHFPADFEGWQTSVTTAAEEAEENCSSTQVYLIYKCVDMRSARSWSHSHNVDRNFWFQEPEDLSIVEIQPVCIKDKKIVSRSWGSWGYGKVLGELQYKPFSFVPEPKFESPHDIADLERNVRLYLLYRTGEERGHIAHLRKFGPFKGYSVAQKQMVAAKLLSAIEDPKIGFTDEDLKILKNGLLGKATMGFENLIKEYVVHHEFSAR